MSPPTTQTLNIKPSEGKKLAISEGVLKIPEPILEPTAIIVSPNKLTSFLKLEDFSVINSRFEHKYYKTKPTLKEKLKKDLVRKAFIRELFIHLQPI